MRYEAILEYSGPFVIVDTALGGALLKDGGFGFGEPVTYADRNRAEAKAEWLNLDTIMLTKSPRRKLRAEVAAKYGIPAEVARGLLN